ncbi:hypothetical protein [Schaedlerella arabinosiphila]|uniref:hypothetical protein n=1 Tax=Schaedlerella arabinosiphila TaxID=2044587 RepID=UPI0025580A04|nr:hypothetical protein [Schaedlerella arabinosiphila]
MEETIRTESGGAGWLLTKQAAEGILVILLGAALLISQVFSSMPENRMGEEQFRNADIVGSKLHAWNPDSSNGAAGDGEYLILKKLLLEERSAPKLCLTERAVPEQTLILPDVSEGNVWDAETCPPAIPDIVEQEPGIKDRTYGNQYVWKPGEPGNPSDSGTLAEPVVPGNPSGIGNAAEPVIPGNPSGGGTLVEPTVPGNSVGGGAAVEPVVPGKPSGDGTLVEPTVPGNSVGGGAAVEPSVPGSPSGDGTLVEPTVPGNSVGGGAAAEPSVPGSPSGDGTLVEPTVPGNSAGGGVAVEPTVPENPSGGGTVVEPSVPGNPSGDGTVMEPTVPENPSGGGTAVEPSVPGNPSGDGTVMEPTVPDIPSEGGTVVEPSVPGNPSGDGTVVDPAEPEGPIAGGIVEPSVPENPSGGGTAADPSVPDTGEGDKEEQPSVSCFLLDEMGMLYGFLPEYAEIPDGCLTLPAECTGIRRGAFSGCGAGILELYIPAGAVTIEEGALADLVSLEWIDVESGNSGCVSDSGVLFDSTMSVLLAFPSAWMDIYSVPSYVTRIADRAFDGTSLYRLDLRECSALSFGENVFGSSGGCGIEVAVRESELALYAEILSGYAVTLTK